MIYQWFSEFFCMKDTYLKTKIKKKILLYDLRILYTFLQTLEKSSLHDYRIKNILHYEKEKNRPSENERESRREKEREKERGKGFVPWRRLVRESVACEDEKQKGAEGSDERIRPALERKNVTVIRPQGEEKLAVAASHWPEPRRRRSERSPIPVRSDEPLSRERDRSPFPSLIPSPSLFALSLATPDFILYSLRSAAPFLPLPPADRSRKITENDLSERKLLFSRVGAEQHASRDRLASTR